MKTFAIAMLMLLGVGPFAYAADYTPEQLEKASRLAASKASMDAASAVVDTAKSIQLKVLPSSEGEHRSAMDRPKAITILPTDPEWADVVAALKAAAARASSKAATDISVVAPGVVVKAAPTDEAVKK